MGDEVLRRWRAECLSCGEPFDQWWVADLDGGHRVVSPARLPCCGRGVLTVGRSVRLTRCEDVPGEVLCVEEEVGGRPGGV